MIEVRELRVDYDDVCAVRDLSLDIGPGEIYGLIGPNGAGKTTTLRALAGLLEPTYGEIRLNGFDLDTHHEDAVRAVGFMPDIAPLYEDLKVWEYLDLFAASYDMPRDERPAAIDAMLSLLDLTEKRDALTAGLSRGMTQRLLLAKTLLPAPRIVLLDEPASGVDPHGRALLKQILRQLSAQGVAVIISSHILSELSEFCTGIGIMEKGRLVESGRVEDVAARVLGRSTLLIEVLDGVDRAAAVLADASGVVVEENEGGAFVCSFTGDPAAAADLLAALLTAGVRVASFTRRKESLEDVFMSVGAREVS